MAELDLKLGLVRAEEALREALSIAYVDGVGGISVPLRRAELEALIALIEGSADNG